jgi:hypothetical protein
MSSQIWPGKWEQPNTDTSSLSQAESKFTVMGQYKYSVILFPSSINYHWNTCNLSLGIRKEYSYMQIWFDIISITVWHTLSIQSFCAGRLIYRTNVVWVMWNKQRRTIKMIYVSVDNLKYILSDLLQSMGVAKWSHVLMTCNKCSTDHCVV